MIHSNVFCEGLYLFVNLGFWNPTHLGVVETRLTSVEAGLEATRVEPRADEADRANREVDEESTLKINFQILFSIFL